MSYSVQFTNVVKKFGDYKAVNNANFTVNKGEFFTLLGPSGCGKTTLLRMVAGFNEIDEGEIRFDEKVINFTPAHKRNIGMVFQNYAIFPHLSVYKNVAYGLKARKVPEKEIQKRVEEALQMVRMEEFRDRQPAQLSGGQQQRIALARAIVIHPDVLLMDEPLSNLDAKLRVEMRSIIKKLQKDLGITTIYVTHDQEEALAISDRIAVMKKGVIQQIDVPEIIYKKPANAFIANFIGTSNFIPGTIVPMGNGLQHQLTLLDKWTIEINLLKSYEGEVMVSVRPEQIELQQPQKESIQGKVILATFLGDFINYEIELENKQIIQVNEYAKAGAKLRSEGDWVSVILDPYKMNIYDEKGKEALL
ncbi:MAG: ABC transporter ATP-binding protein [Epulopiscium sp.]|nr:ABC transporter ATP-binding protein [Candidatus Epulonipiscium sp.]